MARMGGDACESAVESACETVGLNPWIPPEATTPRVATGWHARTAMSRDGDWGPDVTCSSDRWNGVLQPDENMATDARITWAMRLLTERPTSPGDGARRSRSRRRTALHAKPE